MSEQTKWSEVLADTLMKKYPRADEYPYRPWSYPQGFMLWGMIMLYESTLDKKYYDYVEQFARTQVNEDGSAPMFTGESMDDMMTGAVLVWMYERTKLEKYRIACEHIRSKFDDYPRVENDGSFWHNRNLVNEFWVDGVFMGQMFMSKYARAFGHPQDFDETALQLKNIFRHCRKGGTGLLYHAWSADKKAQWADPETGLSSDVWSEGLGWVALILAEVMETLPKGHAQYQSILGLFSDLAKSLKETQDPVTGLWYQVVDKGNRRENWHDTSGSAMFTYMIKKGVLLGLLSADEYGPAARRGYEGIVGKAKINKDGMLDIYDACDGVGVQLNYDAYIDFPRSVNAKEAVAAFLWAAWIMEFN